MSMDRRYDRYARFEDLNPWGGGCLSKPGEEEGGGIPNCLLKWMLREERGGGLCSTLMESVKCLGFWSGYENSNDHNFLMTRHRIQNTLPLCYSSLSPFLFSSIRACLIYITQVIRKSPFYLSQNRASLLRLTGLCVTVGQDRTNIIVP